MLLQEIRKWTLTGTQAAELTEGIPVGQGGSRGKRFIFLPHPSKDKKVCFLIIS